MRRLRTRLAAMAMGCVGVLALAACAGTDAGGVADPAPGAEETGVGITVGVAMPTETSERWIADGDAVKQGLEALGYDVELQFGGDDIPTQQRQIDAMIAGGVNVLIIAAIDGSSLTSQMEAAAAEYIPVIAYDRLLRDSEHVDFYVTFDNYAVGVAQAEALLEGMGVEQGGGPYTIELFAGSRDDNNAYFFYDGAMATLEPYLEDGTIVVGSGETEFDDVATLRWSQPVAQQRMEELLAEHYAGGQPLHGVLSPYDGISRGIITALQEGGLGPTLADGLPVVTGQDAEIGSVKLINDGVQSSTIFKDTRTLAEQAVLSAKAFVEGSPPEAIDIGSYNNGVKDVHAYLIGVDPVFKDDIGSFLVDSGYYTQEEVDTGL